MKKLYKTPSRWLRLLSIVAVSFMWWGVLSPVQADVNIKDFFGKGTLTGNLPERFVELGNPLVLTFFVFAGLTVFAVLIYGGYSYIMGAGSGDGKRIAEAQQAITWGLVGLALMVGSYWIVRIVEIMTGLDFIQFTPT